MAPIASHWCVTLRTTHNGVVRLSAHAVLEAVGAPRNVGRSGGECSLMS